jgi:hypothetical protein
MDDIILYLFSWSDKSFENFAAICSLFCWGALVLTSILHSFLSKKWLQLYKTVYSKYMFFEDVAAIPNLSKQSLLLRTIFFIILILSSFFLAILVKSQGALPSVQFLTGMLLGYFYILLDFLGGIVFFLFIRCHPEDISGTAYFKKNTVARLRLISISKQFSFFLILTILMPTYYMCGLLTLLSIFYGSVLAFNHTSRIE